MTGFLAWLSRKRFQQRYLTYYLMLLPTITFFIIFNYIPMSGIYYAFTRFSYTGGLFGSPFVGLDNFKYLFKSGILLRITRNTVLYNIAFIFFSHLLQIIFAIMISRITGRLFKRLTQSMLLFPYFVSFVILRVLVYNLFNYEIGLVNATLAELGASPYDFYNKASFWPFIIVFFYLWKNVGYGTVIYLAAITGIDTELYESASIDGAGAVKQIFYITVPLLKPTFVTLFLFSLGSILKGQFELFYQLIGSNGNLFTLTDIIDTYVFRSLTFDFDIGRSAAAGVYQSIFGFLLIMSVNGIIKRKAPEYALF
ncbi:MAG: ABC transporter permease subunit [Clostridiales bacterium]|jgi:putative aldouronate transport system permease protein|nr:ABC transporter permease subunit [Clostridiales bacterium]